MGRARHEKIGQVDRQQAVRFRGEQRHRVIINLFRAAQRWHAGRRDANLARVIMRRFAIKDLAHIPHHGIGVEIRPVMEFHAATQAKHPARLVIGIHRPFGRKTGDHHGRLIGRRQIPHRQAVKQRNAGEAVAFKALVGLAIGQRNIRRRHADAQRTLSLRDGRA